MRIRMIASSAFTTTPPVPETPKVSIKVSQLKKKGIKGDMCLWILSVNSKSLIINEFVLSPFVYLYY